MQITVNNNRDMNKNKKVVFLFSGQGLQYPGMGRELCEKYPFFREKYFECLKMASYYAEHNLMELIFSEETILTNRQNMIKRIDIAPLVLLSFQYALANFLMMMGIYPNALLGHSIGEYIVAVLNGVLNFEDAIKIAAHRGKLMKTLPEGRMLAVPLERNYLLKIMPDTLSLAADHGESCIVSGKKDDITSFSRFLKKKIIFSLELEIERAGHSYMMKDIVEKFKSIFESVNLKNTQQRFVSSAIGNWISGDEVCTLEYWTNQLTDTVKFDSALNCLLEDHEIFIEISPGHSLIDIVIQKDNTVLAIDLIKEKQDISQNSFDYFCRQIDRINKIPSLRDKLTNSDIFHDYYFIRLNYDYDKNECTNNFTWKRYDDFLSQKNTLSIENLSSEKHCIVEELFERNFNLYLIKNYINEFSRFVFAENFENKKIELVILINYSVITENEFGIFLSNYHIFHEINSILNMCKLSITVCFILIGDNSIVNVEHLITYKSDDDKVICCHNNKIYRVTKELFLPLV